ncbi:MAG: GMC family oxidoreductase [Pseudomonadota bacterium]
MGHHDVAIVGAGAAGAVLAARLSEDRDTSVVLIEAGGAVDDDDCRDPSQWPFLAHKPYDYAYRTVPQAGTAGRSHLWSRGRGVGGSTLLHAMAHVRGHDDDFDGWTKDAGPDWSANALAPGFARVEAAYAAVRTRRGGPPLDSAGTMLPDADAAHPLARDFVQAGRALGLPALPTHNGASLIGATLNTLLIGGGARITIADAYLGDALLRPNLTLLTGAVAETLMVEQDDAGRAIIKGIVLTGSAPAVTADTVILAAGAIDTPLLLMRSGIGRPETLSAAGITPRHTLGGVGENLQDHLFGAGNVYRTRALLAPSRQQHSESLMYAKAGDTPSGRGLPDVVVACVLLPAIAEGLPGPGADAFTLLYGITHPKSRGTLRPTGPGLGDPPAIDPQYLTHPDDRATMTAALTFARRLARTKPLFDWVAEEHLPGESVTDAAALDDFNARALITHHHPAGTCAIGTADHSPLTPDLAVRGTQGLYVCDASAIPTLPSGPINAAVSAMAEVFAERLKRRL